MDAHVCKNYKSCPIFTGMLQDKVITSKGYKKQYCEAGDSGWLKCKRYIVKESTGKCPPKLLPNAVKPLEEIIAGMD